MQDTYRCPECHGAMPTLNDMREHMRSDHAKAHNRASEPPAAEFAEADEDDELTEKEEEALERQDVLAAEEDLERGKAAVGLEPQKWV